MPPPCQIGFKIGCFKIRQAYKFLDTQYMNILSKFRYGFYCIKRQRKGKIWVQVKYKVQNRPFFSHAKHNKQWVIIRVSKISNNFALFKVNQV